MPDPPPYGFRSPYAPPGYQPPYEQGHIHYPPYPHHPALLSYTPGDEFNYTVQYAPPVIDQDINSYNDETHILPTELPYENIPFQDQPVHECGYCWAERTAGRMLPDTAFRAGRDKDGCPIYAGRAFHEGDLVPAKVIPDKNIAYISYGGEEIPKETFEVLCQGEFMWEFATNGEVPYGAIEVGKTADGEKLYMGRCMHEGSQTPGKIQVSHGCLYIPFNGEEISVKEYEVLVMK